MSRHPAFRALMWRAAGYTLTAMVVIVAAQVALSAWLPDTLPWYAHFLAALALGVATGTVATHIIVRLLHDRREAAFRELRAETERRAGR